MKSSQQILNEIPEASMEKLCDLMVMAKQETEMDRWNKLQEMGKMSVSDVLDYIKGIAPI